MTRRFLTISKPLIVLLFLFCFVEVHSQNITWFKVYDGSGHHNDAGNIVCKADGDNFLVAGYTFSGGDRIFILKINQYGDTLFSKIIGSTSTNRAFSIVPDNNGNFYLTGDGHKAFVIKININGDVIWEKYYSENSMVIYDSKLFSDNSLVSCGRGGETGHYGYIQKIDSSGDLKWNKTIPVQYKYIHSVEEDFNGNVVVTGSTTTAFISKYTTEGSFIYEKEVYSGLPVKLKRITGGFVIGGSNFQITKVDTACNFLSIKNFSAPNSDEELKDFQVIDNNKYYMCGYSNPASSPDTAYGKVIITDTSGTVIHSKLIPNAGFIRINSLYVTLGGDIVFTGYRELMTITAEDILIFRTNQFLEGPTVGINNTTNFVKNFEVYQNYPNPFNPTTQIRFSIPKNGIVTLKIYNTTGKEVYTSINYYYTGTNQFEYSAGNLSSGVYFYSLQFGETIKTQKMIFVK